MEMLNISKRDKKCCHSAKKIRKMGKVPGILYGKQMNNYLFEIGELELNTQIRENGEHGIINLEVEGSQCKALIKEVQRDVLKHNIIHIDLEELNGNEIVQTEIPLVFEGEKLIKSKGGIIQKEKNYVKVQCNADDVPKNIKINISNLDIGEVYRVGDMEASEEITFMEPLNSVIVSITDSSYKMPDIDEEESGINNEENIETDE